MKKIIQICLFLSAAMFLFSCGSSFVQDEQAVKTKENIAAIEQYLKTNNLPIQKTANGVYYVVTKANPSGKTPVAGDQIAFQYVESVLGGSKVDTSTNPVNLIYGVNYGLPTAAVLDGMSILHAGEKATIFITSDLAYGGQTSQSLPSYSVLKFDLNIISILTEDQQIEKYVTDNKLKITEKTATNLRYILTTAGTGDVVKTGQNVSVNYTGKFLTGKQFDTGSFTLLLGSKSTVAGFEEVFHAAVRFA